MESITKMNAIISIARHEHANLAFTIGIYFGYPLCCRTQFCEKVFSGIDSSINRIDSSGFIPCDTHYAQIKAGMVTLESLIKDRVCPTEFNNTKQS